ncbi:L,D-transpeptidase [Haliangium sp.]|uniref:L,D-transpeptidase n=1 Tax=Haliangium sp. TaxID=2663208 RepID=UPI003D1032FD
MRILPRYSPSRRALPPSAWPWVGLRPSLGVGVAGHPLATWSGVDALVLGVLGVLALVGCAGEPEPESETRGATTEIAESGPDPVAASPASAAEPGAIDDADEADDPAATSTAPTPPSAPGFPDDVASLRLTRSISVRATPHPDAERIGTIARDIRVGWQQVVEGEGCEGRWVEIEPRGWVCEEYLEPSPRRTWGVEVPRLGVGEIVPGVYGRVIAEGVRTARLTEEGLVTHRQLVGSVMVRRYGEQRMKVPGAAAGSEPSAPAPSGEPGETGETGEPGEPGATSATAVPSALDYWLIDKREGEYLAAKHIREFEPSTFQGTRLGDDTGLSLPLGFPLMGRRYRTLVPVHSAAEGGRVVRKIAPRVPVSVHDIARDQAGEAVAYRIGEGEWVRAGDMRLAATAAAPAQVRGHERWFDIDLDQQVLVAYEGREPVYVTLISSGTRQNPTETGLYRNWIKFAETDMRDLGAESPYSVATVPWSQFFSKDLALHTAYWHEGFGTSRSHGCINLAPRDARFLYFWSDPQVPPGWSMAHGTPDHPGSLVRVRSKADPEPELRIHGGPEQVARSDDNPA